MELGFLLSAIRRYAWVVVVGALLGALPGLLLDSGEIQYESLGVLSVVPPADSAGAYVGDPDRYVSGQLSVLRSSTLATAVASDIPDTDAAVVGGLVQFEHLPETDIVLVRARSGAPEFSQQLANGYLDQYVEVLERQLAEAQRPIDDQITATEAALDQVDNQIATVIAPYLDVAPTTSGDAIRPIPGIDQVAPSLASSQSLLRSTLVDLQRERARIQTNSRVESVVVERGTLAAAPIAESNRTLVVGGVLAGTFAGLLAAILTARLSPRVLDDQHVEEILGRSPYGRLPHATPLRGDARRALEQPPDAIMPFVDSLRVRVETTGRPGEPLTTLVIGTERGVGTTTVAAALAHSFATGGSRVLFVDADGENPTRPTVADATQPTSRSSKRLLQNARPTALPNLSTATLIGERSSIDLRRRNVGEGVIEATKLADVAIFDGGSLSSSAASLELARRCDCVVLVLSQRQQVRPLALIADELRNRHVIAVWSKVQPSWWQRALNLPGSRVSKPDSPSGVDQEGKRPPSQPELAPGTATGARTAADNESLDR